MKKIYLAIIASLMAVAAFAQHNISGVVMNVKTEPVIGATVMIKGTLTGTTTDIDGKFTISAKPGDVLLVSCLGMIDNEYKVTPDSSNILIKMMFDNYALEDAVVIGYGTVKKTDLTGSVASIKAKDLSNSKVGMVSSALQGMAAGVQVTTGNLKPGADASIIIRGAGSVNAGTEPLYIIDGVPMSGLQDVSSADIASIEVLKDASSAAIYGSRGSNGVVLITTKHGDDGKSRVSLNAMAGVQTMLNKQELMTAQQYYDIVQKSGQTYLWTSEELRLLSRGESTDWQDAVTQNGTFQNYNLSLSSGSKNFKHFLGLDYYNQQGIVRNSSFEKITIRYNMDSQIKKWLKAGARFNIVYSTISNINEESNSAYGTMFSAISSQPTAPIFASDGKYFDGFLNTKANPVAIVDLLDKKTKKLMTVGSVYFTFTPIKNLEINSDNSARFIMFRNNTYEDGQMGQHYAAEGKASVMANFSRYYQSENTITYKIKSGKHNGSIMGGFSASRTSYEEATAAAKGINPITRYNNLTGAEVHGTNSSAATNSTLASFFTRMSYAFDERYLLTVTLRADGSSRFAEGHRWGFFPSAAFAWKISEEKFLKNSSAVNNLKLRLSAGRLGNQNIGDYKFAALVTEGGAFNNYVFGDQVGIGAVYSTISNPELTWEKANQFDLGIDFGFLKNKISGTIDGYYKRTTDLLWTVPLPKESGYSNSLTNVGILDNRGIEFSLNTININSSFFQWSTNFNITYNKNNVVELYDGKTDVSKSIFVGHPLNEFYLLHSLGIWQLGEEEEAAKYGCIPGDRKIEDKNNDGAINGDDRKFAGNSTPRVYGGLTNTFTLGNKDIGNFDITVFINFAADYYVNNSLLRYENSYNPWGNMGVDYYNNYWTIDRPSNYYPSPRIGSPYLNGDGTDVNLQDGSYLRIKNLELGYSLPYKWLDKAHISSLRIYASVQNLYTATKFTGYDIEASDKTNSYPGARAFIGGISLNF